MSLYNVILLEKINIFLKWPKAFSPLKRVIDDVFINVSYLISVDQKFFFFVYIEYRIYILMHIIIMKTFFLFWGVGGGAGMQNLHMLDDGLFCLNKFNLLDGRQTTIISIASDGSL